VYIYRQYLMQIKKIVSATNILIKKHDGNKTNQCVTAIKWINERS